MLACPFADCENLLKKFLVLNPTKRASLEVREPEIHIPDFHLDGAEWKGRGDGDGWEKKDRKGWWGRGGRRMVGGGRQEG